MAQATLVVIACESTQQCELDLENGVITRSGDEARWPPFWLKYVRELAESSANGSLQHRPSNMRRYHQSDFHIAPATRRPTTHHELLDPQGLQASGLHSDGYKHGHELQRDFLPQRRLTHRQEQAAIVDHNLAAAVENVDAAEVLRTSHEIRLGGANHILVDLASSTQEFGDGIMAD